MSLERRFSEMSSMLVRWIMCADESLKEELEDISNDSDLLKDAFYQDLTFGTAGLRGIIGAGTNRMNVHTVGQATQGLADYLNSIYDHPSVAIARDSRLLGETFVKTAASVLAANGIKSYVYPRIVPTPALSFAVRDLGCQAGINMTASHNPSSYNGYKAYGPDGCQITSQAANAIQQAIASVDIFDDVKTIPFDQALAADQIVWIGDDTLDRFIAEVEALSPEQPLDTLGVELGEDDISVVYTPLNGTGLECARRIFDDLGVNRTYVVPAQAMPDGRFPTCPYPNPEEKEALSLGLMWCEHLSTDLLIATDPDADRVGIAVLDAGKYKLLSGNEVGALLLDYLCSRSSEQGGDLKGSVAVTTIVSSLIIDDLATHHGIELRRTLTGFKYIGEQIALLEASGHPERFIFGFEESYGYLSGSHVRDKDAVNATMLICQMARWHKLRGRTLVQAMEELYLRHGYRLNKTASYSYKGADGSMQMQGLMSSLREHAPADIAGLKIVETIDYRDVVALPVSGLRGVPGETIEQRLPQANVIEFRLDGGSRLIIRPSGTEPKIKAYLFASAESRAEAESLIVALKAAADALLFR